jgi:hypothetical protein
MTRRSGQAGNPSNNYHRRRNRMSEQFVSYPRTLLESPVWQVISLSARRVLDRIAIEHMNHGGRANGRLSVTYDDFVRYGIHRHAIAPAIREAVALGFLEVTAAGVAGAAQYRQPNRFRLTYVTGVDSSPTHEWRRITTREQATEIAAAARAARTARSYRVRRRSKIPVPAINTGPSGGFRH